MKNNEWKDLNVEAIQEKIINIKKDIILMQIDKKTKQTIKPHEIKKKQHELAQLLTVQTFKLKS